jgi:CubicO group peptidase (beta-lactamase class C family)
MKTSRILLAVAGLTPLWPALVPAGPPWTEDEVRTILADRVDRGQQSVGLVVGLVDEKGRTVVGYGRRGGEDGHAPDGDTVFEIGSVTKVFTSTLLSDAVRRGKLALDDPARKLLPEGVRLPSKGGKEITLAHLATHTSGLPRMPDNLEPADPANPYADYTVQRMYEFLSAHELRREPGAVAEYSNLGAGLLGHVLALAAGSSYESLVRERITGPLGMKDTAITLTPAMRERLARGHDASLRPAASWDIPTLAGAGALRSTANDMLTFLAANLGLVESGISVALEATHVPREKLDPGGMQIGLGWIVRTEHDRTIHWHNGGTGGYHAFVGFDRAHGTGVVVLSNAANSIDDIGLHLLDPQSALADVRPPSRSKDIPATPAGQALASWLGAVRSKDAAAMRAHYESAFAAAFKSAVPVDPYVSFSSQIASALEGASLERFDSRGDHDLSAYARAAQGWLGIHLQVEPQPPHRITGLLVRPESPPQGAEPETAKPKTP